MSPALTRQVMAAMGSRRLFVMYGATEASARLSFVPPSELPGAVGSIGRAIPNVELTVRRPDGEPCAVDEVGELFARGSNIMSGYWNDPEETARVLGPYGYRTGDLARCDAEERLWLVGRARDMLKVGGHRVSAKEIEDAILEHDAVHECAVIGVPDEILGDRLRAFVVLKTEAAVDANGLGLFAHAAEPIHFPVELHPFEVVKTGTEQRILHPRRFGNLQSLAALAFVKVGPLPFLGQKQFL